ncbi:uncharacterized protein TRIADDRAFT_60117 [Trichoplax adhaerens]|uniref:G-protein coupled receptors family 2 profile 2 domain-containing protein n=1 Tax=Trichoplax adhaerens TaxID=10228 RepID=B3S7C5_TRIAD|nr:hypothetical protein TRIADDRAFT_60117 [Trichoplax adhaerens]EDV21263.1 hypothetical protein TRIADDRAFT_60117 [Trichoplax adhaerens]|eukprot:XP_002116230.1 hypothetical protein TRIADDRAFT_60117 [Trichoplax adhaerens]
MKAEEECDNGWTKISNRCFKPSEGSNTFDNARRACQGFPGGDLAVDDSYATHNGLYFILHVNVRYWIGLKDLVGDNVVSDYHWLATNQSVTTGPQFWMSLYPANKFYRCVHLADILLLFIWRDGSCNDFYRYVCQKPIGEVSSSVANSITSTSSTASTIQLNSSLTSSTLSSNVIASTLAIANLSEQLASISSRLDVSTTKLNSPIASSTLSDNTILSATTSTSQLELTTWTNSQIGVATSDLNLSLPSTTILSNSSSPVSTITEELELLTPTASNIHSCSSGLYENLLISSASSSVFSVNNNLNIILTTNTVLNSEKNFTVPTYDLTLSFSLSVNDLASSITKTMTASGLQLLVSSGSSINSSIYEDSPLVLTVSSSISAIDNQIISSIASNAFNVITVTTSSGPLLPVSTNSNFNRKSNAFKYSLSSFILSPTMVDIVNTDSTTTTIKRDEESLDTHNWSVQTSLWKDSNSDIILIKAHIRQKIYYHQEQNPGFIFEQIDKFDADLAREIHQANITMRLIISTPESELVIQTISASDTKSIVNLAFSLSNKSVAKVMIPKAAFRFLGQDDTVTLVVRSYNIRNNWTENNISENNDSRWSEYGMKLKDYNSTTIHCITVHFTSFAILMQNSKALTEFHDTNLRIITYIGYSISLFALLIMMALIISSRKLHTVKNFIHLNLALAMTLSICGFISGIHATKLPILCTIIAIGLHFLYLASLTWMMMESLLIFRKISKIRKNVDLGIRRIYFVLGWMLPAIIVGISASTGIDAYRNPNYCWIRNTSAQMWFFVGPVILIMMCNVVIMTLAIKSLFSIKAMVRKSEMQKFKVGIKAVASLIFLFGISWLFGILYYATSETVFAYLFTILNCPQLLALLSLKKTIWCGTGLLIFYFHCFRDHNMQDYIRTRFNFVNSIFPTRSMGEASRDTRDENTRYRRVIKIPLLPVSSENGSQDCEVIPQDPISLNKITGTYLSKRISVATLASTCDHGPYRLTENTIPVDP